MTRALVQIPEISIDKQIRPEKIPGGGFIWGVCFKLPEPAAADGHIIQQILQEEESTVKEGEVEKKMTRRTEYWEAWEVKKGQVEAQQTQSVRDFIREQGGSAPAHKDYNLPMNDIFYRKYPVGTKGKYTITGLVGFYHQPLTSDFIVANSQTGAGGLRSTTIRPRFFSFNGLYRQVRFNYQCITETEYKDDSKQHLNYDSKKLDMIFIDNWFN